MEDPDPQLRESLKEMLFDNKKFKWDRLEDLLSNAAKQTNLDLEKLLDEVINLLFSPNGGFLRNEIIEGLTRKVHEGEIFSGVVTRIIPIGAFVEILPGKEGMVHISQLSEARVERVEDVVRQGDEVTVRVREIDSRGRINLTLRGVGQNNGMSYPEPTPTPVAPLN